MNKAKLTIILNSIFFVLGFSVIFSVLGVLLESVLSSVAYDVRLYLNYLGGAVIILFGLFMLGVIKLNFLQQEHKFSVQKTRFQYLSSFIFGGAFAVGWTPCVGAVLGAVITLAATRPEIALPMMLAYSLGLGLPFILAAIFISQATGFIKKAAPFMKWFNLVFGALLVIIGILVFTNNLAAISSFGGISEYFSFDSGMQSAGELNLVIAFVAGLASFLSPCVLPLVPAYLTFIGGTSLNELREEE